MRSPREDDADALARHLGTGHHHHGSRSELAPAEKGRHKRVRALAVVLALGLLRAAQVSYARADETTRALVHLFYQAPAILIAAVWLWGANLFLWRRLRFDPHPLAVFQLEDARAHLTHARVWGVARASSLLYLASLAAFLRLANGAAREEEDWDRVGATKTPRGSSPRTSSRRRRRRARARALRTGRPLVPAYAAAPADHDGAVPDAVAPPRVLRGLFPRRRAVLAREDAQRRRALGVRGPAGPAAMFARHRDARFGACGSTSWHVPLVLALPSAIRLAQCLRQARDGGLLAEAPRGERAPAAERREGPDAKRAARLNALKYFSAFPVVLLSHLKYSVSSETWTATVRPCWVACAAANTAYSLYWDVTHDWDLRLAPALARECFGSAGAGGETSTSAENFADDRDGRFERSDTALQRKYLRPRLLYGDPNVYFAAVVANAALRLSWTYKLSSHLRHNAGTVLAFTAMEITRRFLWSMFRVEKAYLARWGAGTQGMPR